MWLLLPLKYPMFLSRRRRRKRRGGGGGGGEVEEGEVGEE